MREIVGLRETDNDRERQRKTEKDRERQRRKAWKEKINIY